MGMFTFSGRGLGLDEGHCEVCIAPMSDSDENLYTRAGKLLPDFGDLIANVNFRDTMNRLCEKIEAGHCDRIHILPAGKNVIKHGLFTVEGTGTMIADNYVEEFRQVQTDEDVAIVYRILTMYKRARFLKPRSKAYLSRNRQRFFVTAIDGIVVGCLEKKIVDERTVELGALAISTRFRNQRVGVFTVNALYLLNIFDKKPTITVPFSTVGLCSAKSTGISPASE